MHDSYEQILPTGDICVVKSRNSSMSDTKIYVDTFFCIFMILSPQNKETI